MKRLIKMAAVVAAMVMPSMASAQDKLEPILGVDVVSNYVWRGQNLGNASFQPTVGVAWKGISLSAWGSYDFVDKDGTKEIDLTLAYNIAGFNVGITDYFAAAEGKDDRYFYFKKGETSHVLEGNVGYDFGILSFNWYTNFLGNDWKTNEYVDENGDTQVEEKRGFSSYFEIAAPFKIKNTDWTAAVGCVPYKSAYYDVDKFAVTNVSLKCSYDIQCGKNFKIPVFGQLVANPAKQALHFAAGFTIGL